MTSVTGAARPLRADARRNRDAIVAAAGRLTNGQVILMHDWPANTRAAIPRIAQTLAAKGLCSGMISPQTGRAVAPG